MESAYNLFKPMRIFLISASCEGRDNFMPATWCFPLSSEPQLFGVAIVKKRFTYDLIQKSREYVINIPGEGLAEMIEKYGRITGRDNDKFALAGLTREKSEKISAVSIKECLQSIECKVINEIETGDHVIFVGKAENVKLRTSGTGIYSASSGIIKI